MLLASSFRSSSSCKYFRSATQIFAMSPRPPSCRSLDRYRDVARSRCTAKSLASAAKTFLWEAKSIAVPLARPMAKLLAHLPLKPHFLSLLSQSTSHMKRNLPLVLRQCSPVCEVDSDVVRPTVRCYARSPAFTVPLFIAPVAIGLAHVARSFACAATAFACFAKSMATPLVDCSLHCSFS